MKIDAKRKNRIISYALLAFFAFALVLSICITAKLISNVKTNRELIEVRDQLVEEIKNQGNGGEDEDCYTVYVKDDYTVENAGGTIYIFKK